MDKNTRSPKNGWSRLDVETPQLVLKSLGDVLDVAIKTQLLQVKAAVDDCQKEADRE